MKIIIAAFLYIALFAAAEIAARKFRVANEYSRKTIHGAAGILTAFLPFFVPFSHILALSLVFMIILFVSKKIGFLTSIHGSDRSTYGEVYYPAAIATTALLFPSPAPFCYALLVLAISDSLAGIVGKHFGKKSFTIMGKKSYAGSITFFLSAFLLTLATLSLLGKSPLYSFVFGGATAALLTFAEASLSYGLDNLILPPLAAVLMLALL